MLAAIASVGRARMRADQDGGTGTICFSATASFGLSAGLFGIGALTLRRATAARELPYAAIPMLLAVQQAIEGALWLVLPEQLDGILQEDRALVTIYLVFANVLWPIFVPTAVWLIESSVVHRKRIMIPLVAGAATSLFYGAALIMQPVSAEISGSHIDYHLPHSYDLAAFALYAIATCLAPLLSSHKLVRLFGLALIISMIFAYALYTVWFASVWCFFAALLSVVVFFYFVRRDVPGTIAETVRQ
ncbi:hypothetical protein GCM10023115_15730 [Pontixanthobacter gangjinensis]